MVGVNEFQHVSPATVAPKLNVYGLTARSAKIRDHKHACIEPDGWNSLTPTMVVWGARNE